uniref:WD repeat-containing protein 55 homolog n=1 Tax=Homalodisca liturata TaxID=320908 RepID=A0A1B6JR77_9HEMI
MHAINGHTGTPLEEVDEMNTSNSDLDDFDDTGSSVSSTNSDDGESSAVQADNDEDEGAGAQEDEEDSVITAIMRARDKPNEKPPDVVSEDYLVDISFHPSADIIAGASVTGDALVYQYSVESTDLVATHELHTKACRAIEFSQSGDLLFTTSADKSIMVTDSATGKLRQFYDDAHEDPVYTLAVIDEHLIATGDENGVVRMWDLREKSHVFSSKKMEDYVSKILTNEEARYLVCCSGEGTITSFDIAGKCVHIQSELYEAELTSAALFRKETKLVVSSTRGSLLFYKWGDFGLHTDELPWATKRAINCLIPISENIAVTGWEDGQIRATYLFPNRQLGVVGRHDLSVESLDISHDGAYIASSSLDQRLRFWPIAFFEDPDLLQVDKAGRQRHLPSSNVVDRSEFFADLA